MILKLVFLFLLILASGVFSSTETAFTSLSIVQLQELETKRGKRGKLVKRLASRPDILLTTILIGNNLVNIGASALATQITIQTFGNQAVGIMTGVLTFIILIFAEVTPKRIAIVYNDAVSLYAARFILFLSWLLRPIVWLIGLISNSITRLFRAEKRIKITLQGILHMINLGEHLGIVERYETKMVRSIFRINDITVQAVMTHRTEVFSLEMNEKITDVIEKIIDAGYSRIPVYDTEPETIAGIVLVRDIMKEFARRRETAQLKDIMIKPIVVPQSKMVNEMFSQFSREQLNMAIVLDEYGGLAGVVTVEDIIEEIIGDIYDEHETNNEVKIRRQKNGEIIIAADISLHQLYESINLQLQSERYAKTLAGYLTNAVDHIPVRGEEIEIDEGSFIIEEVSKNRIVQVRYIPNKKSIV
jgi:putative hemolysin